MINTAQCGAPNRTKVEGGGGGVICFAPVAFSPGIPGADCYKCASSATSRVCALTLGGIYARE